MMHSPRRLFISPWTVILIFSMHSTLLYAEDTLPDPSPPQYYAKDIAMQAENNSAPDALPLAQRNNTRLRAALPMYENAVLHPWPVISTTKKLKLGSHSTNVTLLRARLAATQDIPENANNQDRVFDVPLQNGVKNFQERHGLKADGIVGKETLRELNISPDVRLQQLQVNIQRWEELSARLNNRFIMVNVPDFQLYIFENNKKVLSMKAIVGKFERQTPEINSRITHIVLHPYWNVPKMIAQKDIVPKVMNDPTYLDKMQIKILDHQEDDAIEINSQEVDWEAAAMDGFPYHFRQDPGEHNALGLVKFEFQNSADIYLHDTPAKDLFNRNTRMFSSGCIRLENPFGLVEYLMQTDPSWSEVKMQDILDTGKTTYVKAAQPTPIFITYLTAWVDEKGMINFRDDIYGKDTPDSKSARLTAQRPLENVTALNQQQ